MSSKTVKDYQGDPIHENVRMFERELKQKFPQLRVTSGYRKKAFTKQGNVSQHAKGGALDLGYDKEIVDYLANTYEGVGLLNKYGLGVLDESTKEVMDKTGATGAHLHVGMDSGLVAKAKERYKQLTPKENITPELTDFDFTTQTPTFALEDSNVEEDTPKEEDKSKEVEQAKEVLKEEQFMSDMFKGKITPIQLAQEEAPQQAPQSNLLESFSNIESFVDSPLAQQGLTVPRKKISLEELDAKMAQTRALLNKGRAQQSDLKERPKEVVRENTQTTYRNEKGKQVNTNPNQQIATKHINERRTESQIIADRNAKIAESIAAQNEDIIGNPNWRQALATQTQSTGDKFRIFPNEDSFVDNYLNPGVMIGDMASNLGQAPLRAQQNDSYMPYVTSVGAPLVGGAFAGYGTQGTKQFVNNLVNPLAGTGEIVSNLGNKYLPNTYKLNPFAFKPSSEMGYRMLGKEGFDDAIETGVLRAKPVPNQPSEGISLARNTNRNPNTGKMQGALDRPYFADGFIDKRYAADYMVAVNKADNNLIPIPTHKGIAPPQAGSIPLENATIYKKDWLQGYKKVKQEGGYTEDEQRFITDYFQQGGTVEERQKADKDWLTNWYANRVIPNERLQELYLEDKDIYNERMKNVPTVTNVESIDNNPYITGRYNSENGQILMTPKSRDNVYLHEVTHYSDDFPSAMRTVHNQVVGLNKAPKELTQGIYNEKYDYFTDSDEVHARIQVLRKEAGITPEQNVTKEYLDKFLKDYKGDNENINDLLNIADPPHLLEMLNYMALNKDKTIKKGQLAQEGGYTEEEQRFITDYFQQGGQIPISSKGMWEFPNQKVVVPTNGSITMKNIPHKIKATSLETGETKILLPGLEYFFDKTQNVLEVPLKK